MSILLIVVHVVVCIALIMIVLLQTGKGADMGAAFGGGSSQTLFGSTGASTFLSKATTVAAIVFMLTSLTLAYMSGGKVTKSVVSDVQAPIESRPRHQRYVRGCNHFGYNPFFLSYAIICNLPLDFRTRPTARLPDSSALRRETSDNILSSGSSKNRSTSRPLPYFRSSF
jgi:preprotein translocase subunit SecG